MRMLEDSRWGWALAGWMLVAAGCARTSPVATPKFDPAAAAKQALAEFDANKDGTLDATELEKCPGLRAAKNTIDSDQNGSLSEAEIAARIGKYVEQNIALVPVKVHVLLDDKPLGEATVTLVPEPCLTAFIKPASGVTDKHGLALLSSEGLAAKGMAGVNPGLYRVQIVPKPGAPKPLPAKYNAETTLGQEVALDAPELERGITLKLSSR